MDNIDFKNVISAAELVRLGWRPHGWLLWQMVPQGGITLLAGETASGKSFLGLDLALGMASGRGKAWDMDLGEEIADSSWVIGERKSWPDNPSTDNKNTMEPDSPKGVKPASPLMGNGQPGSTDTLPCVADPPSREGYVGLPLGEAGSSRETDGRLKRVIYEPSFPSASLRRSSTTASGPHLPLIPSHRARRVSRALLRGDLAFNTNNGDLALGVASGRGKAWDMDLGEGDVGLPRGEAGSSRETDGRPKRVIYEPSFPSALLRGSKIEGGQRDIEQKMVVPYNVQLKDPSQAQDDNPHRVRYFCADADPNLVAERVLRLCRGYPTGKNTMGIEVPEALDLDFHVHAFSDPESFNWLQKEVLSRGYQLLIFDGLAQYLPGMADGSASAVGAFLRGLRQLTSQTGVSVVLIHQFNKRLAARLNKWGLPTSQGEERVRGSSELLAGVDSVLLLSRPEAMKLGGMGRNVLKVVKNRLGQAGARLQFTIVDGDSSLHLLFERLGAQAQPRPRRLVDAAFDEMMRILMEEDERKFDRSELTRLLGDRINLPSSTMLNEAFTLLGKDERVRVERDETRKKRYSWAQPGTGALESKVYGLPPAMALDFASSYLLTKARLNLAEQEMEKMQNKASSAGLVDQLTDLLQRGDGNS